MRNYMGKCLHVYLLSCLLCILSFVLSHAWCRSFSRPCWVCFPKAIKGLSAGIPQPAAMSGGQTLMKTLRNWPRSSSHANRYKKKTAAAPLHPWLWLEKPWVRVHLNFAGPFMRHTFLITVDPLSKRPEVILMTTTTSTHTVTVLRQMFAVWPSTATSHGQWPTVYSVFH